MKKEPSIYNINPSISAVKVLAIGIAAQVMEQDMSKTIGILPKVAELDNFDRRYNVQMQLQNILTTLQESVYERQDSQTQWRKSIHKSCHQEAKGRDF